jgi:hypothetical protein
MSEPRPGRYQHYKGNLYEVVGIARHSETMAELVVYKALYDHPELGSDSLWVRPRAMFVEEVELNGRRVPRFARVSD